MRWRFLLAGCVAVGGIAGCVQILGIDDRVPTVLDASTDQSTGDSSLPPDGSGDAGDAGDATADGPPLTTCGDAGVVDLMSDPAHCGTCTTVCNADAGDPSLNYANVCTQGQCGIGCAKGWGDCDKDAGDGCELPLNAPQNCGACGNACGNAHTTTSPTCDSNTLKCKFTCAAGFAHCSANDSAGCETDLTTTNTSCGSCGYSCGNAGTCMPPGACLLTSGENIGTGNVNPIAMDGTALYWMNDNPSAALRKVDKATGVLTTFGSAYTLSGNLYTNPSVAVDLHYVYWINNTTNALMRGLKNNLGSVTTIQENTTVGGRSGLWLDTDATLDATRVFTAGGNLWMAPVSGGANVKLDGKAGYDTAAWFALIGTTAYVERWTVGCCPNAYKWDIDKVEISGPPNPSQLYGNFSVSQTSISGMTTDGTSIYVVASDQHLWKIDAGGTATQWSTTKGPNVGVAVSDGTYVYVAGSNLYRVPLAGGPYQVLVDSTSFPVQEPIKGVQVDGTDIYFSTNTRIWKTKK